MLHVLKELSWNIAWKSERVYKQGLVKLCCSDERLCKQDLF